MSNQTVHQTSISVWAWSGIVKEAIQSLRLIATQAQLDEQIRVRAIKVLFDLAKANEEALMALADIGGPLAIGLIVEYFKSSADENGTTTRFVPANNALVALVRRCKAHADSEDTVALGLYLSSALSSLYPIIANYAAVHLVALGKYPPNIFKGSVGDSLMQQMRRMYG